MSSVSLQVDNNPLNPVIFESMDYVGICFSRNNESKTIISNVAGALVHLYPEITADYISGTLPQALLAARDRTALYGELYEIKDECAENGWDTPNSVAIPDVVFDIGEGLIALFPRYLTDPEITPENDGALSFEWRNHVEYFDLSITSQGGVYYIAKVDGVKSRGRFEYSPAKFPIVMEALLKKIHLID